MIEDTYVLVIAFLSFVVGLLTRGELSRIGNKKHSKLPSEE
ncbi:MAG: hypothetical protein ABSG57_05000 [Candidatus Bathyarchaeia archaeon]|jgi:hypothetical protein